MSDLTRQRQRARHARRVQLNQPRPPHQSRRRLIWATVTSTALATIVTVFATGFSTAIASRVGRVFADPPVPQVKSTDVRYVGMFDEVGHPVSGFTVDPRTRDHGDCWEDSIVSSDPGAYRCIDAANSTYLLDPCWEVRREAGDYVGCLDNPWSRKIIMVRLSSDIKVGAGGRGANSEPWGLEVQDPRDLRKFLRCTYQGGVNLPIGGWATPWKCTDSKGRYVGWIVGELNKAQSGPWQVFFAANGSDQIVRASVKTAWE